MAEEVLAEEERTEPRRVSRRGFLGSSALVVGGAVSGLAGAKLFIPEKAAAQTVEAPVEQVAAQPATVVNPAPFTGAPSQAYLVVDPKKCSGCASCMLACSSAHEKKASLSASRIQIVQTALAPFPFDLDIYQCRQCTDPLCVENCPTGACKVDAANGNVRIIDQSKCIGCQTCLRMCPHPAHRTVWNAEANKATKCDLCADAPYLGEPGGPGGKQACVMACPMEALQVVTAAPVQTDDIGYVVNLRKDA